MTYFQDDNGNVIELTDDFTLTRSCANLFTFQIKGDYSISFQLPNTSYNRKQLGYYTNVQTPNPAFSQYVYNLVKNGNIIGRGSLVVERDDDDFLYLFFISGNSNWINLISGSIKELDYEDYALFWDVNAISNRAIATTGFVFPLVDWSCQWKRNNYGLWYNQIIDSNQDYVDTSYSDFYPCFFVASAVIEILKAFNIKLAGDILTDQLYNSLIITPTGGQIERAPLFLTNRHSLVTCSGTTAFNTVYAKIAFDTVISDGSMLCYDTVNQRYVANKTFTIQINININLSASVLFTAAIYQNGSISPFTFSNSVASTVIQSGEMFIYATAGDYFEIFGKCAVGSGNVQTNSTVEFQPRPIITGGTTVGAGAADTIRASDIFPDMPAIDFIKFVVNYFCCIPTYDHSTGTLTLNKLDNYRLENAVDWSQFVQLYENNYAIKTAQNNYIRLTEPDDPSLNGYNSINNVKYGETLIPGQSQSLINNDLVTIPFGAAVDKPTINQQMMLASIPLVDLEDDTGPFPYGSVTNLSPGVQLNISGTAFPVMTTGQIIRIYGADGYNGYAIVSSSTTTTVVLLGQLFLTNNAGFFYVEKFSYKTDQSRLLYFVPNVAISAMSNISTLKVYFDKTGSTASYSNLGWAYFCKPSTNLGINIYKRGVNVGPISLSNDIGTQGFYFKFVTGILKSPYLKIQMLIPEYNYAAFQFGTFIYIKTEDQQKYYLVDSIENYKDSKTLCQVNLLLKQ